MAKRAISSRTWRSPSIAGSPIERLVGVQEGARLAATLKLYSDPSGEFSRDYHALLPDGGDTAGVQRVHPA